MIGSSVPFLLCILNICHCNVWENYMSNGSAYPATKPQMIAIRIHEFGGPEKLKLETCDVPPPPNHDQVLILVKASAIYPWDVKIRKDQYARPVIDLPAILGQEVSGIVVMAGKNVKHVKPGDRVFAKLVLWEGGYAQLAVSNGIDTYPLPESFTYEQGAITYHLYFGAWRALILNGRAQPGQSLFVIGANRGNGLAAIQVGKAYGLKVIGSAGSREGLIKVKEFGADHCVDHTLPNFREHAKEFNEGQLFDLVLEDYCIEWLGDDQDYVKKFTGHLLRHTGIEVRDAEIRGWNLFTPTDREKNSTKEAIFEGIKEGWYTPHPGNFYLLHQAQKAHIEVLNKDQVGDLVFSGVDQHEMLYPFLSEELKNNLSNVITPTIRDLVELYQPSNMEENGTKYSGDLDARRQFLHKNVNHQLYGGTTMMTTEFTDYFEEMMLKYSTNTVDLHETHDEYFEKYLRDYAWWTMPENHTRSKTTTTTETPKPTEFDPWSTTTDKYDRAFSAMMEHKK